MIHVCSLREMPTHDRAVRPRYLVSLVTPVEQPATPPEVPVERHMRVDMDDVCAPFGEAIVPCAEHIRCVLDGLAPWPEDAPILFHCVAGVSRSMAMALITAASRAPGRELALATALRRVAPHAQPNRLMIELGDAILGCEGRLIDARVAMGPAVPVEFGPLVAFPPP